MGELLARISSRELTEWIAYANVEPFGEDRADIRAALIAAVIAETVRDKKKRRKPFTPAEFVKMLPRFEEEKRRPRQTMEEQIRIVEMLNVAFGGQDLRDKK